MFFDPEKLNPSFFIRIALRSMTDAGLSDEEARDFACAIASRAFLAAGLDSDAALFPAEDHPGYLHRLVDEQDIFVPFHLAVVFPGRNVLQEMLHLAQKVRLGFGHPICLSGSATFLGAIRNAADLDFCEYFLSLPQAIAPIVQSMTALARSPFLVGVECFERKVYPPRETLRERLDELVHRGVTDIPGNTVMLDFVGRSTVLGISPITSLVLPIAPDETESGNALLSFAYQEAVLCVTRPPRSLLDGRRYGEYVDWLRKDGRKWLDNPDYWGLPKSPLKSLKRALSLCLVIGYDVSPEDAPDLTSFVETGTQEGLSVVDLIIFTLNEDFLTTVAEQLRLRELLGLVPSFPDEDGFEELADVASNLRASVLLDDAIIQEGLEGAKELASALSMFLDLQFEQVEGSI